MIKNDVNFMKKVFSDYLFLKLGLLISTYVISQSNIPIYASEEKPYPPPLFFSIDSPNQSFQSLEKTYDKSTSIAYQVVSTAQSSHPPIFFSIHESENNLPTPITLEEPLTEVISSTPYPSMPEPYYPVSLPHAKSPPPENLLSPYEGKQEYIHTPHSSVLPPQEKSVKKQLLSISEAASKGSQSLENEIEGGIENFQVESLLKQNFERSQPLKETSHSQQNHLPPPISQSESPTRPAINEHSTDSSGKRTILINFNNVSIIELIRFISRISNKNFVFDEADLQFNVTIVSEEPTTIENIMTALLQELRIHDLTLIEQGNNLIIHKNPKVNSVSKVVADDIPDNNPSSAEIVTQVFRLNTLEPDRAIAVIRPLVSDNAILEFIRDTNHLIVTDLHANVLEIGKLLKSLDAPNSGLVIGQYVAKVADISQLVPLVQQIMSPISKDNPLVFVPYENSNSIFIVSSPFLVERSISILQHLDQEKGKTRIINLQDLQYESSQGAGDQAKNLRHKEAFTKPSYHDEVRASDGWDYGPSTTFFRPSESNGLESNILPLFIPVEIPTLSPTQQKELDNAKQVIDELEALRLQQFNHRPPPPWHVGVTDFATEEVIQPETIRRNLPINTDYIPVPVNRSKFYIHKLQYRRGDVILAQIQQIGTSLQNTRGNEELLETINTIQWLEDSKSLVFTGAPDYLNKVRELVEEIDLPLRQVYIEMLILDTSVDDSLNYAVNWANRFGGGNQAGSQGFTSGPSTLQGTMDSTGVADLGTSIPNPVTGPYDNVIIPDPRNLAKNTGFSLGVIGQHIIHKGLGIQFNSIGALVTALHTRTTADIVLNPKIITEDNVPAQIFVGITTPFKTQSVSNDQGSIITNNFEFRDVGTSLQVTPHLHNSDLITLDIFEERSSLATTPAATGNSNQVIGPTTNKNSTKTTVHVPSGFFVIISGMIEDDTNRTRQQVPCLGNVPLIGGAFRDQANSDAKRNVMMFIQPRIIDTDEEYQNLTRHQQDVWQFKYQSPKIWLQEAEEGLDFFNVKSTINTDDADLPACHQFAH